MPNNLIANPVKVKLNIRRNNEGNGWWVGPAFLALPQPKVTPAKNIIFVLDVSASMTDRLAAVKDATQNLLDQLAPADTYSIVSFNGSAQLVVTHQRATPPNIALAKNSVDGMSASGSTSFLSAFSEINNKKLIKDVKNTTIIFLTDGQDRSSPVKDLLRQVSNGKHCPRIVPIGILAARDDFLDSMARSAKSIYINRSTPNAYLTAFQEAFDLALERSAKPAHIKFDIEAKGSTRSIYKRELTPVKYDGRDSQHYTFKFDSAEVPTSCKLQFSCDDISLRAEHRFTAQEREQLGQGRTLAISVPKLKCKDNRTRSWLKTLGLILLGLLLVTAAAYSVVFPPANLALPLIASQAVGLLGLGLSLYGLMGVINKTLWLPSKMSEPDQPAPQPRAAAKVEPVFSAVPGKPSISAAPANKMGTPTCLSGFWGRLCGSTANPGSGTVASKPSITTGPRLKAS